MKYLKMLFQFLLPILKVTAVDMIVDTVNEAAGYHRPLRRRRPLGAERIRLPEYPRSNHASGTAMDMRPPRDLYGDIEITPRRDFTRRQSTMKDPFDKIPMQPERNYHDVVMVAFDIFGPDLATARSWLEEHMPKTGDSDDKVYVDAWWIADDDMGDQDLDSAVFCKPGMQKAARTYLRDGDLAH